MKAVTIHRLAYNRRPPPMAWRDKKTTRDDTNHMKPRQLPSAGYANPEVRAVAAVHEAMKSNGNGAERDMMDPIETRRMVAMEREMDRAQEEQNKPKIEQIKDLMKALTYGEMMDLAQQWSDSMLTGTVDKDSFKLVLPPTLHAWATSRERPLLAGD